MSTIDVLNTGSQWSTVPEAQNSIPKQLYRNKTVGNFRDNIKSVSNSSDQKLSRAETFHTVQRISDCRPNSETTATVNVPLKAQVSVMGTLTLVSGSGDGKGTLNLHVPAKHVGNPLVQYSLVEKDGGTTFARTLDRKERMILIADSATDSTGNKLISAKGIQYNGKNISWGNIIAWQEPEAEYSTFDKSNNIANLKLFIREKNQNIILNEKNELPLGVLYGKESLQTHFPTLMDTSKSFQENKVSEYVKSLVHEFGSGVPARVIGIGTDADAKESFGKDKLYHLQNNINLMFRNSNGRNWESLQQSKRHADSQALTRSMAKKHYAKGIDALCADWPAESMEGWTEKDKLRCAVIENLVKEGRLKFISKADAAKYLPTIYNGEKFKLYINTVYANSDYRTVLGNMVNSNDFSGIQDVKTVSSRVRAENIKGAISSLEELASLNPKKIKSELKRKEKELLNHLEHNGITDDDAKTLEYGQEIGKLARQLNLLKNKAYRKEIISLKIELKNITGAEPGSMASMVAECLKKNNVEYEFSQKGIDTLRELRDSKISGLHELKNKYERESSRQQIAWLDNHIESFAVKDAIKDFSVVRSYYHDLSPKDKVLFLQQESAMAWDKYASYSSKEHTSGNRELARKYHHLAITRESQLKYLLSSIEKMVDIKGANFTFSSHALREINSLNDDKLASVNGTALSHHQNKESKEQCRATEKQAKRINEFLKWASDLPQNAKTNVTVGQPSQPEASEHIVDTQATEAAVSQSSESVAEGSVIDPLAPDAVIDQTSEQVEKNFSIDMLSNEEEMGPASESELATEAAVSQFSKSAEDKPIVELHSGNETLASNVSTVPVGPNTPEFKITFNNKVYTLKNVNTLEEMAWKTSDRAEKKQLLEEIKEQKSIFKKMNIPFKDVEFTENGMYVTKLEMQNNGGDKELRVQVKYFYDSNGKLDELATEYKPISGSGDLNIPGVNGKIYTIPGCSYKKYDRGLAASHFYEHFKQVEEAKTTHSSHEGFIEHIDALINENRFDYIRSMTLSELDDFREQVGRISQQKLIDSTTSKIESYFKPQIAENENNPGQENITSINSGNRIPIINSETKGLDPRLMTIVNEFPGVFEEYKNNGNNFSSKVISEFCKSNENEVRNILAKNYIELKSEGGIFLRFMADLLFVASRVDSGAPYLLKDESTVQIKSLLSPDVEGFRSKGLTSIKFKNGVDLPLNELFVKKRYSAEVTIDVGNKFNYPVINETTSFKDKFMWQEKVKTNVNNSRILLDVVVPAGRIAQEVIKNNDISEVNIESKFYKYDDSILEEMEVNENQFVEIINNFRLKNSGLLEVYQDDKYNCDNPDDDSYFDFKMIETNSYFENKFNQYFGEKYSDSLPGSASASGDNALSDFLSDVEKPRDDIDDMIDALVQDDNASLPQTGADKPTAAVSVKSVLSPVSENISQELPQRTLEPSQSLQENNVISKTMSGREIRRLQESSRSLVSNSNETYIQKNEKVVENSQNIDKIKRQEPSLDDLDDLDDRDTMSTLKAFIRNTVQHSSADVKAEIEISALIEFVKSVCKKEIDLIEVPESYSEKEREKMFDDIKKVSNKGHKKISILDYGDGSFQLVAKKYKKAKKESIFEAVSRALPEEKNITLPPLKHRSYARFAVTRTRDIGLPEHIPLDEFLNRNCDFNTVLNMRTPTLKNGGKNDIKIQEIKRMKDIFSIIKSGDVMSVIKPLKEDGDYYLDNRPSEWPSEPKTVKISNPEVALTDKAVAPQPADSKTSERGLSRKELNRLYSNQAVLVQ